MRLLIASNNRHKIDEITAICQADFPSLPVLGAAEAGLLLQVEETGQTFQENALLKAQGLRGQLQSGDWVLADDSGLVVPALDGRPGIHSARYAGPGATDGDNLRKLLEDMRDLEPPEREGRFVCVLAVVNAAGETHYFTGEIAGVLLSTPRGAGGFGYDPIFLPHGWEKTFAEAPADLKNAHSHRAEALGKFLGWLRGQLRDQASF